MDTSHTALFTYAKVDLDSNGTLEFIELLEVIRKVTVLLSIRNLRGLVRSDRQDAGDSHHRFADSDSHVALPLFPLGELFLLR